MNKILVLGLQDCNSYFYLKCCFTFDKLLYKNAKFDSTWISELTQDILPLQVFEKEDYDNYIELKHKDEFHDKYVVSNNGTNIVYTVPKSEQLFLDSFKTLYTYNDSKCVKYINKFTKNTTTEITNLLIDANRINTAIYENGVYIFNEAIEKNSVTLGAYEYLKELKSQIYTEPLATLRWLNNLTNTLKTLIRWYY